MGIPGGLSGGRTHYRRSFTGICYGACEEKNSRRFGTGIFTAWTTKWCPAPAGDSEFPACGVRIVRGRHQDPNKIQCVTDPAATAHGSRKIAFACCDANTCSRRNKNGQCLAGDLRKISNFAPKDWYEATDVCAAEGKVLCGVDTPCSRSGCSYDNHYQWTGEACQAGDVGLPAECA